MTRYLAPPLTRRLSVVAIGPPGPSRRISSVSLPASGPVFPTYEANGWNGNPGVLAGTEAPSFGSTAPGLHEDEHACAARSARKTAANVTTKQSSRTSGAWRDCDGRASQNLAHRARATRGATSYAAP